MVEESCYHDTTAFHVFENGQIKRSQNNQNYKAEEKHILKKGENRGEK
jgi:hypothetical protein